MTDAVEVVSKLTVTPPPSPPNVDVATFINPLALRKRC